jgi:hypothetical protein
LLSAKAAGVEVATTIADSSASVNAQCRAACVNVMVEETTTRKQINELRFSLRPGYNFANADQALAYATASATRSPRAEPIRS